MMAMSIVVWNVLVGLRRALSRAATATFTGELSARQASVLRELAASGPVSQVTLARATASDPAYLVRVLDGLEKRGFVQRERSTTNRREVTVSLTSRGEGQLEDIGAAIGRLAEAAEARLSPEERRVFVELALRVTASLTGLVGEDKVEAPHE